MKRYVCHYCRGTATVLVFDPPQDLETYTESDLPGYMVSKPCPLCVEVGAPPFIDVPQGMNDCQVEAIK